MITLSDLPKELLINIASAVQEESNADLIRLTHCGRDLRLVLLDVPELWTHIVFETRVINLSHTSSTLERVAAFLERSCSAQLHVKAVLDTETVNDEIDYFWAFSAQDLLGPLFSSAGRFCSLQVAVMIRQRKNPGLPRQPLEVSLRALDTPQLKCFYFTVTTASDTPWLLPFLTSFPQAPNIRLVSLWNHPIDTTWLSRAVHLRELALGGPAQPKWTAMHLFSVLLSVSHIQHLRIRDMRVANNLTVTDTPRKANFTRLSRLTFSSTPLPAIVFILSLLETPSSCAVYVETPLNISVPFTRTHVQSCGNFTEVHLAANWNPKLTTSCSPETSSGFTAKEWAVEIAQIFGQARTLRLHIDLFQYFQYWELSDEVVPPVWPNLREVEAVGTPSGDDGLWDGLRSFLLFAKARGAIESPVSLKLPLEFPAPGFVRADSDRGELLHRLRVFQSNWSDNKRHRKL